MARQAAAASISRFSGSGSMPLPAQISGGVAANLWLERVAQAEAKVRSGVGNAAEWKAAYEADNANMNRPGSMIGDRINLWTTAYLIREEENKIKDSIAAANRTAYASGNVKARGGGGSESAFRDERDKLLQDQIAGTEDLIDALDAMRRGLLDLKNELIGGALDPSNPALKYASEREFVTGLGRQALTGDMAAAAMFQEQVGGFLQLSQGYNASSAAYASDFATMIDLLDKISASMEKQQTTATATLKVQQSGLSQVADSTERTARSTDRQARAVSVLEQRAIE
jgi:hypothetical protein